LDLHLPPTNQRNLDTLVQICNLYLSVPLALEKVEDPSTVLPFLGIMLDTIAMEARLPEEKLHKLREEVAEWVDHTDAKKREILSLVGSLQHATKLLDAAEPLCPGCSQVKGVVFPH